MMKQKILAVLTSLCIGVLPLAAGMAAAPVAAEDSTEPVRILAMGDSITGLYQRGQRLSEILLLRNAAKRVYQFRHGRTEKQLV